MMSDCLNCGAGLHGPFCSACGQRSVPPDPNIAELAGDAWQELSGYDGRIAATVRGLVRPGFLTREYLAGRRARYLSPVRLYLIVSVMYFLAAAAAPASARNGQLATPGGVRIGVTGTREGLKLSAEERAEILASAEKAPAVLRPMLVAVANDPVAFRARVLTIMPRVFFALLPVFAAILALFYRGRPFPTSLVFAVHLHAFAFAAFTLSELVKLTGAIGLSIAVGAVVTIVFVAYALMAFRAVFGGGWPATIVKGAGIGLVYLIASLPAFAIILFWASLS
ncbi:MAG TPA: DUF3667 domain-containing protein [Vicinamibacterales bacterium]|nr:DUF3667 domain-containing protein [Vicinamibacterales bacterium]